MMQDHTVDVRRIVTVVEDVFHEGGPRASKPMRRGAVAAVIANPFAGRYVEDIAPFMETLKPLGVSMAQGLLHAMEAATSEIESYGKGAIVGSDGELEHAALWHAPGGHGMRQLLASSPVDPSAGSPANNALAIVPSAKKVGGVGASLDVPLSHINAVYVRSHFDTFEVRIPDAPRSGEIVFILTMGTGPRVHSRLGGLTVEDISQWDGQR